MAKESTVVFERPHALLPVVTNYCPGCSHGIVKRLVLHPVRRPSKFAGVIV